MRGLDRNQSFHTAGIWRTVILCMAEKALYLTQDFLLQFRRVSFKAEKMRKNSRF